MNPVRIFRHLACEGPGYLDEILVRRGIDYQMVCIDDGHPVPSSHDGVSGLVFMGGSMSANDSLGWIDDELALIGISRERDIPMLGICLGGQLLSRAYGASVKPGRHGQEIGWHDVERVDNATAKDWLADCPERMTVFHWHGETFGIPVGAQRLLSSHCYPNQAWVSGNTLALQCHPEITADMAREWTQVYTADLGKGGDCNQTAERILDRLDEKIRASRILAERLFNRWLDGLEARWS